MSGSITGSVTIITNQTLIGYGFSWAGTSPVGAVTVQVSNDYALNEAGGVKNAGTWTTLTDSAGDPIEGSVSGNSGTGFFNVAAMAGYAIRPVYTRASGVGTLQCKVTTKVS
jgi:hypothetical protein